MAAEVYLTPEAALERISGVAAIQTSLRGRFEGITWVLWGMVVALQAMTLGAVVESPWVDAGPLFHLTVLGTHLWVVVGIAASVGVWRAAAVSFDPGVSRRRALAFFVAWPLLIHAFSYLVTQFSGGAAAFAFVVAGLLAVFAAVNPVRFTPRGRWTAALLAVVATLIGVAVFTTGASGLNSYAGAGAGIGLSWIVAGLIALYQG